MNPHGWLQLALYVSLLAALTVPMGKYLLCVLEPGGRTWLDPLLRPLERFTYRILRVDPVSTQSWQHYAHSLLSFSAVSCLFTYALLRGQHFLPLNPEGLGPLPPDLAFNTAVSFVTNTNWQSYAGESTMSYFSQMVALTLHQFASAAVGIGVAAVLVRGLAAPATQGLGHFWVDLVRITYYVLLPFSIVFALFLVSQGTIQNFRPYLQASLLEPHIAATQMKNEKGEPVLDAQGRPLQTQQPVEVQRIPQGPMASQVAIKMLGTNGGGYANANAAHPFENPTPLANFVQMLSIFCIGSGLTVYLGRMARNRSHGWSIWAAMMLLFLAGTLVCWWAEAAGNPLHQALGVATGDGNMEGKEVRFGIFSSALFATITTDASCGAVNAMHDSFTPLGGLVPLFNMQLGEIVFGGVGAGLYGILLFVVLAVFIAGLLVGRTPEYLGKKIGAFEVKMAMLALLVLCLSILLSSAWAAVSVWGRSSLANAGPHGLSEILYAFSSATGNNGSAFAGLNANTPWLNTTLGLAMLVGRFGVIIPVLAMAGSFAAKKATPASSGTLPVSGLTFVVLLIGTILLVGALSFLPALVLGPILEHFLMLQGNLF